MFYLMLGFQVISFHSDGHTNITIWYNEVVGLEDINPLDNKGNTPLMWAVNQNQSDVVKYYIDSGYFASSKIFKYRVFK